VLYDVQRPVVEKIETIAKEIYGADGVIIEAAALRSIKQYTDMGYGDLPICIAKTQYSLSDDASKLGRPENFTITIREVRLSAGAGFMVAISGNVMTMPGLPKRPTACNIDIDDKGIITGLF
jgi:formate--tetrahydrofolate ligase